MRYRVPQFIEIEDKIFGPLTWKQFLYVGGGFGMAVALFFAAPFWLFVIVGLPIAGLAGALAFYPMYGRPFSIFLESAFNYIMSERKYFWNQDEYYIYKHKKTNVHENIGVKKNPKQKIANLSRKLQLEAIGKEEMNILR